MYGPEFQIYAPTEAVLRGNFIWQVLSNPGLGFTLDQCGATLAKWLGVGIAQMAAVFPDLGYFATPDLGFLA